MASAEDDGLRFGPLGGRTIHLCIDMQVLFAGETAWHTPWMTRVLPAVTRLAAARAPQSIFTRFIPAETPEAAPGTWHRYYDHWRSVTLDRLPRGTIDLLPPLAALTPPALVLDKTTYSPWHDGRLDALVAERGIDTVVFSGGETDVCVLAGVLGAVDRGLRTVIASDALCSGSDDSHDALMLVYRQRYGQQIETAEVEAILAARP